MSDSTLPVVVGVDGSTTAAAAAKWAAAVADKFGAPLELVNGMPGRGRLLPDAAQTIRAAALADHRQHATEILNSTEEQLRAEFPELEIFTLRSDEPADELLTTRSKTARLVVVGSEEISPTAAMLMGSTTLAVTAHSACPVATWRGSVVDPTDQPVLIGVDGTETGSVALQSAFLFAEKFGVGLKAVHAWSTLLPAALTNSYLIDLDGLEALRWQGRLSAVEPWTRLHPDVEVTYFVEQENPGRALLRHAADSQLVVVGSRGRNLVTGATLGSTGLNLLAHCAVPVMICHAPAES